jgi:hypothetical protein
MTGKLYQIEVDDYVIYHKSYFVWAENSAGAKAKLAAGDYWDMAVSERGETSHDKSKVVSIQDTGRGKEIRDVAKELRGA